MKKIAVGFGVGIVLLATSATDTGAQWIDSSRKLAQAIGAELIDDPVPTDAASTPKPEMQPAPKIPETPAETPESKPDVPRPLPQPKPIIFDTTV